VYFAPIRDNNLVGHYYVIGAVDAVPALKLVHNVIATGRFGLHIVFCELFPQLQKVESIKKK
jgi:hypothetical protein